jgi:biopolymer transport protein ExbB
VERYREVMVEAKGAASDGSLSARQRFKAQAAMLQASLDRLEALVGGERFEGRALTPSGRMESGHFLVVGPSAFFASAESPAVGAVQLQLGSPEPAVVPLSAAQNQAVKSLIESGTGELSVDPTMGNALKFQATKDSFIEHLSKGGPVIVPILVLGVMSVLIFTIRWLAVGRVRVASTRDLQSILNALNRQDINGATGIAQYIKGPVGEMLKEAIRHYRERKEYVEEVMYEKMLVAKPDLEKLLPFLALSAAAAPLLGLLGTVTGMINTFNAITVLGAGDPKTLAGGISEALITTEFGLIVAIPSLLLHAVLSRRVKGILGSMEQTATGFINGLPGQSEETIHFKRS